MRSRSRSRLSKWLLVAVLVLTTLRANGSALMIDTGRRPQTNHCVYCINFLGWIICITTTEPIDGDADPGACMY